MMRLIRYSSEDTMRTQERFRGVVTRLLALSLLAAVPGSASTQPIPLEIDVGTLYEGALSGSIVHTARVSRPGAFALFIFGGREPIAFSATLPDGSAIDHQFSDTTGNFLFLDVDRAGSIDLEFDVDLDPRSDSLFYAFVLAPVVDLAIDEWGLFDLQRAPIAGDANEALGLGVFRVRPPEDVLLTLEIERERYNLDIRGGGPDASSSVYDKYAGDPSEESAVLRQAVRAGTEFGFIVLREPIDGVIEAPIELSISTEALVPTEPRELSFNEFVPGRLDTFSPLESGRKAAPYYYEGTAGEQIAIVLESVDFDTLILVRTPAGDLVEDDDGAWQTNSILELTLPESGRYDIFATSFAGSETGEFAIQVLSPQDARDYVAGMDPWGYEESEEFASEEIEEVFLEDTITGVTGLVVGAASEGSISETSSVYRGSYVEVFEVTLASSIDLEISLTSDSFDTLLIVTEPAGSELDDDDGGSGTNSRLRIPAAAPGTYRIYARAWDARSTGPFRLAVNEYVAGPSAESARATRLESGRTHFGRITDSSPSYRSRLVEVYELRLSSRSSVDIQLRSDEFDAYLFVVTPNGYVIEDDDGMEFTHSRVLLDDVEAGLYRVYVSSFGGQDEGEFEVRYELR